MREILYHTYCWFISTENLERIIIPILAPVVTVIGTFWISTYKYRQQERNKSKEREGQFQAEKTAVIDTTDLAIHLLKTNQEVLKKLQESVSFERLQNFTISIFTNEPLIILNEISKHRYDELFDRNRIRDEGELVVYANFLTGRKLLLELYTRLNDWSENYQLEKRRLSLAFDSALLKYLQYLEVECQNINLSPEVKDLFQAFLIEHDEYSVDTERYLMESEVSLIDTLHFKMVNNLKTNGYFFKLHQFQNLTIEMEIAINQIRRFSEQNTAFLKRMEEHMKEQIKKLTVFHLGFSR